MIDATHAHSIITYGYPILFLLVALEGPIVTFIAGYLASQGYLNPFLVAAVAIAGNVSVDIVLYFIGKHGGRRFIKKWGKYIRLDEPKTEKFAKVFDKHAGKFLVFGKVSGVFSYPILLAAGLSKFDFKKFWEKCVLIESPKSAAVTALGFYFGTAYTNFHKYLDYSIIAFLIIAVIVVGFIFFIKKARNDLESEIKG